MIWPTVYCQVVSARRGCNTHHPATAIRRIESGRMHTLPYQSIMLPQPQPKDGASARVQDLGITYCSVQRAISDGLYGSRRMPMAKFVPLATVEVERRIGYTSFELGLLIHFLRVQCCSSSVSSHAPLTFTSPPHHALCTAAVIHHTVTVLSSLCHKFSYTRPHPAIYEHCHKFETTYTKWTRFLGVKQRKGVS
jgi:hypothetical protein